MTYIRALAAVSMPIMSELLHELERGFESMASEYPNYLSPSTAVASVSTIRPRPIRLKQKADSRRLFLTPHGHKLKRKAKFATDYWQLELAYTYFLFI